MKGGKPGLNVRRKGSTSDLSLYSEDRVLQLENEKERERNRSVKL